MKIDHTLEFARFKDKVPYNLEAEYFYFLNNQVLSDGLVQQALKDVQKSGLLPKTLEKAQVKIFSGDTDRLKKRLGFASINGQNILKTCRLIEFPNIGEDAEVKSYCYKLIPSLSDKEGRQIKYLHGKNEPAIPYIPHETWKVKKKTNEPIWITEGQKKALKLSQHCRYAISVSGVWNFKAGNDSDASNADKGLWSELESFDWRGRTVYLAFDTDLWTNPQVRYALYELSFKLFERGAIVKIPSWKGGS